MNIFINDVPTVLPDDNMNLTDLAKWKNISNQATAIAVNDKLIRQNLWSVTYLKDRDRVTIISAAFGG